jgi:hypothetical protein
MSAAAQVWSRARRPQRHRAANASAPGTLTRPVGPRWQKMDEFVSGLGNKVVELSQDKWMKLAISMLIDIIGILTFLIPVVRRACLCGRGRADKTLCCQLCSAAPAAAPCAMLAALVLSTRGACSRRGCGRVTPCMRAFALAGACARNSLRRSWMCSGRRCQRCWCSSCTETRC